MFRTVQDCIASVQVDLDDPTGKVYKPTYILPFMQKAVADVQMRLNEDGLAYAEDQVVLASVPPGTTDLSTYQASGGQLDGTMFVEKLEWKLPSDDDTAYLAVRQFASTELPDVPAGQTTTGIIGWITRGAQNTIYLTPASTAVTLRIKRQFLPEDLSDSEPSAIYLGAARAVIARTGQLIASRRNLDKLKVDLGLEYEDAIADFEVAAVKQMQRQGFRIGRTSRRTSAAPYNDNLNQP